MVNNINHTYNHLQLDRLNIVQVDLCPDLAVPVKQRKYISSWIFVMGVYQILDFSYKNSTNLLSECENICIVLDFFLYI